MQIACVTSLEASAASVTDGNNSKGQSRSHETEVVIIGSGLGGLCCAAMLATYGVKASPSLCAAMLISSCYLVAVFFTLSAHCERSILPSRLRFRVMHKRKGVIPEDWNWLTAA